MRDQELYEENPLVFQQLRGMRIAFYYANSEPRLFENYPREENELSSGPQGEWVLLAT